MSAMRIFVVFAVFMEDRRILIVDDERDLCDIVAFNLRAAGYDCETAQDAESARKFDLAAFDLFLLDVMMPGVSGFELAKSLRSEERTAKVPIIFLTAKDTEEDKLRGFELGADDYVSKPFSVRDLIARVRAVLNRSGKKTEPDVMVCGGLHLERRTKRATVDGESVLFTPTEFALLWLLLGHQGTLFSRQELLERVWPSDVVVTARTVDVNITRLRKKIGRYASCIVTRSGFGYSFIAS